MYSADALIAYVQKSVRTDDPSINTDSAYTTFTTQDWTDILNMAITLHGGSYTKDNVPNTEAGFVILRAKIEVYYRLATSTAPFYPIEAEGASLRKDYRFEHYMSLIRAIEAQYDKLLDSPEHYTEIQVGEVFLEKDHFSVRAYNHANVPTVELTVDTIGTTSVDISWTKFDTVGGIFNRYYILINSVDEDIYDPYEQKISDNATSLGYSQDIHLNKYRIKELNPGTKYHVLVISEDRNGLRGYSEQTFTTNVA